MATGSFYYNPNYQVDTTPFDSAYGAYQSAASNALPSQASYDTAAARVRSRIEAKQRGDENRAADLFGTSGNAGRFNTQTRQIRQDANQAYATGLADLEDKFNQSKQQGAQILSNVGQGFTGIGTGKANAQAAGEQLKTDAARGNASSAGNFLNTLGQTGGVLSIFGQSNQGNPAWNDFMGGVFGGNFQYPDLSKFTELYKSSAGGGVTVNNGGTGGINPGGLPDAFPGGGTGGGGGTGAGGLNLSGFSTIASLAQQNPGRFKVIQGSPYPYDTVVGMQVIPDSIINQPGFPNNFPGAVSPFYDGIWYIHQPGGGGGFADTSSQTGGT